MQAKRQPVDTEDFSRHAMNMRVEVAETQDASTRASAMSDKPVAEGDKAVAAVDEPVTEVDKPVTEGATAPFQCASILTGESPPASDPRKEDLTVVDLNNDEHKEWSVQSHDGSGPKRSMSRNVSTDPSQSPFVSGSLDLRSGRRIAITEQQDPSSVDPRDAAMTVSATSSSLGNRSDGGDGLGRLHSQHLSARSTNLPPPSANLPFRPSVGPWQNTYRYGAPHGPVFYPGYINPPRGPLQLYGLPEAQSRVEAERKKIMESFANSPSTLWGGHIQQQRGTVPNPIDNTTAPSADDDSRSFPQFTELPGELRDRIYTIVLQCDDYIAPHLCDAGRPALTGKADNGKAIRFHDDNQADHNAMYKRLAITRVSKKVREESLPIFYSANTFDTVADTPTYFSRLEMLGRLHMIRKVDFVVRFWKNEQYSQKLLRMLLQHFEEQTAFEMEHDEEMRSKLSGEDEVEAETAVQKAAAKGQFHTDDLEVLKKHPQHVMGGLEANFLVLRMLSTKFQDGEYNRKLVIHVPTSTLFDQYKTLSYFPSVCKGLGIQLKLVSGRDAEMQGEAFRLSWSQKYQKKDFTDSTTAKSWAEVEALILRVQALYPNIEEVPRPARWIYYRRNCKTTDIEWFSIDTVGGGILPLNQQQ